MKLSPCHLSSLATITELLAVKIRHAGELSYMLAGVRFAQGWAGGHERLEVGLPASVDSVRISLPADYISEVIRR